MLGPTWVRGEIRREIIHHCVLEPGGDALAAQSSCRRSSPGKVSLGHFGVGKATPSIIDTGGDQGGPKGGWVTLEWEGGGAAQSIGRLEAGLSR
jgi:hypothetical protein